MKHLIETVVQKDMVTFREELHKEIRKRAIQKITEIKEHFGMSDLSEQIAISKAMKEEVINELSLDKLKDYSRKSRDQMKDIGKRYGTPNLTDKDMSNIRKRSSKYAHKIQDHISNLENPVTNPKIHDLTNHKDDGSVYDHTQTSDKIKDGDVLKLSGNRAGVMVKAWPVITHGESDVLHTTTQKDGILSMDRGRYKKSHELASSIVK